MVRKTKGCANSNRGETGCKYQVLKYESGGAAS